MFTNVYGNACACTCVCAAAVKCVKIANQTVENRSSVLELVKERFWMLIQRDVGLIPEHIINILDFCGYSANCALEAINDEKLKIIEREAKEIPQIMRISASDEDQMRKYFGKFYRNPQNFHILSGEAQQIKMVGVCLRQKGIGSYLKLDELTRVRDRRRKDYDGGGSFEQQARSLAERIHTFYFNRCDGSPPNIDFCNMLSAIQVTTEMGDDGNLIAHVQCPLCQSEKRLRVSQDRTGHWVLANIVSHMNRHLAAMCNPSSTPTSQMEAATASVTRLDDSGVAKKLKIEPLDIDDSSSQYGGASAYGFTMSMN
ncbi:uncharacterized protein LOC6048411 [Culex quinquefasciatus]|uniref:uncharacterized protein LOC6048411 n=1 Tax=Culex quinquefasciatus TaxID=7176 RepID=UPI0018E39B90|nr:uncharacterized protein LOC6048411 [Culex quinquefasciatus]